MKTLKKSETGGAQKERPVFSNVPKDSKLSIDQLLEHLRILTGDSLVSIGGELYSVADGETRRLATHSQLFAWIDNFAEADFKRGGINRETFYDGLVQRLPQYFVASGLPHFPLVEGVLYLRKPPKAKKTGYFEKLVDRFCPATKRDRELLKAFFLTLFWGGDAGQRPAFTIAASKKSGAKGGIGAGKTTLIDMAAQLAGGKKFSLRLNATPDRMMTGLLTPDFRSTRLAVIDNVRSSRFTSDSLESLVTADQIGGHQLFRGYASYPNLLTVAVTANDPKYCRDMAQRTVVIRLEKPPRSEDWRRVTSAFIRDFRDEIVAEIRWILESEPKEMAWVDRWPSWCRDVLSKQDDPDALLALIEKRRRAIDEDDSDVEDTVEWIRDRLARAMPTFDLDACVIDIPGSALIEVLYRLKRGSDDRQIARYLAAIEHPRLKSRRTSKLRGYRWTGANAQPAVKPIALDVERFLRM